MRAPNRRRPWRAPAPPRPRAMVGACLAAALALAAPGATQQPLPRPRRFTTAEGLPQNRAEGVVQDSTGFVWVGTTRGLWRFDGYGFAAYRSGVPATDAALAGRLAPLFADRAGWLWLELASGELLHLHPATGRLERFPVQAPLVALWGDSSGAVWYQDSTTLHHVFGGRGPRALLRLPVGGGVVVAAGPAAGHVWLVVAGSDGDRLLRVELPGATGPPAPGGAGIAAPPGDAPGLPAPPVSRITAVLEDGRGRVWVAGTAGLARLDTATGAYSLVEPLRGEVVYGLTRGAADAVWGTTADAFVRIAVDGEVVRLPYPGGRALPARAPVRDRAGGLWLASLTDGLLRLDPAPPPIRRFTPPTLPRDVASAFVLALHQARDGALWIGTLGAGLHRLAPGNGAARVVAPPGPVALGREVWDVHEDAARIWFGLGARLCSTSRAGGAPVCHAPPPEIEAVADIEPAEPGALWTALYPVGVARFDIAASRFGQTLAVPLAVSLHRSGDGTLWIGSTSRGLWRLPAARAGAPARPAPVALPIPGELAVYQIFEDDGRTLWLATSRGLAGFEPRTGRTTLYDERSGLSASPVFSIERDGAGGLWLGTGHGIARFSPATGAVLRYGPADGVQGVEFNRRAVARLADGRVVFGGTEGMTEVHPTAPAPPRGPAPVTFTRARLVGKDGITDRLLYAPRELDVPPGGRSFSVEFAALEYTVSGAVRYRYRLDGLDPQWVPATADRLATYGRPPPGRYTLRVQATGPDGSWTMPGAVLPIIAEPAFYETTWFRVLVATLLGMLLLAAHRLRLAQVVRTERLRLRIARNLHDDLGASLGGIALLSDAAAAEAGTTIEVRQQLAHIGSAARSLVDELRDIVWAIEPGNDRSRDVAERMRDVAAELLVGRRHTLDLHVDDNARPLDLEQRRDLLLLFKEMLHNVARHSGARNVRIRLVLGRERIELEIEDDGCGFDPAAPRRGHGLGSLRERSGRLGGSLEVRSEPGAGTRVRLLAETTRSRRAARPGRR